MSRYVIIFDYTDKTLVILSATTGAISIISFSSTIGAPVGIASASFTLIFSLSAGIIKKLLNITRNKKKKHDKILMLAKSKLNSIESLISHALNDIDITHEEFITILNEKDKYERMKYNLISKNGDEKQKKYKIEEYIIKKINVIKKIYFFSPIYKNVRDNKKELLQM